MIKYLSAIALLLGAPVMAKQEAVTSNAMDEQAVSSTFDQQMFAEFKSICSDISSLEAISATAIKSDWLSYQAPDNSIHSKSLTIMLTRITSQIPLDNIKILNFTKKIAGKHIILSLSHIKTTKDNSLSCRMHDYEASQAINPEVISSNLNQEPETIADNENSISWVWFPGMNISHSSLQSIYVPQKSSLVTELYLKGVILVAQQKKDSIK